MPTPHHFLIPHTKLKHFRTLDPLTKTGRSKLFALYLDLTELIRNEVVSLTGWDKYNPRKLSAPRRTVVLIDDLEAAVRSGGFQMYYDHALGNGATLLPGALRAVGQPTVAKIVERANAQFTDGPPSTLPARERAIAKLPVRAAKAWDRATNQFLDLPVPLNGFGLVAVVPFILAHADEFFQPAPQRKPKSTPASPKAKFSSNPTSKPKPSSKKPALRR